MIRTEEEKKKLRNTISTIVVAVIVIILITPVRRSKVYVAPEGQRSSSIPKTNEQELRQVKEFLSDLRNQNYTLVKNNYPNHLHFKWTGPPLESSPAAKADELALRLYHQSGRSVRIILEVSGDKYSGFYRPE